MLPIFRRVFTFVIGLSVALALGCGLTHQTTIVPSESRIVQSSAPALFHEAIAGPPLAPLSVLYPPPDPTPEQPAESQPPGDDVVWVPGYWTWDTHQDQWHWIGGLWLHCPPGRQWTPGYWSVAADGWRWVPGSWSIVAPPPPPDSPPPDSPPPIVNSYSPVGFCVDDPGLAWYGGYGLWWPWYAYRPFHHREYEPQTHPLHAFGPNSTVPAPAMPPLASEVHHAVTPSAPPHLDMAAIFASMPKPLASGLSSHAAFDAALHHEHGGHFASHFMHPELASALHEHLLGHTESCAHAAVAGSSGGAGHGGGSHSSGGHGGGHGR